MIGAKGIGLKVLGSEWKVLRLGSRVEGFGGKGLGLGQKQLKIATISDAVPDLRSQSL